MASKRAVFEEVGSAARAAPVRGGIDAERRGARRGIRAWLAVLALLVVAMIAVGGLTRLTESGLSITEWKPLSGAIPPLNAADWQAEFDAYKAIPQYALQNQDMTLAAFKGIFWWEWSHRQLGRVIGGVWALGFLGFLAARQVPAGWTRRLLAVGVLIGVQGAVGWWMVSSGLGGDATRVASYRLAVHLGLAFAVLGIIAWDVLLLGRSERGLMQARRQREARLFVKGTGLMHLVFWQVLLGALVAGIDAGRGFNDWPLMAGQVIPPNAFVLEPWWRNFFENPGLVQFVHRLSAYLVFGYGVYAVIRSRRSPNAATRSAFLAVGGMLVLQVVLGIATVLQGAQLHVAITHQFGAILLWLLVLRARFAAAFPHVRSVRAA